MRASPLVAFALLVFAGSCTRTLIAPEDFPTDFRAGKAYSIQQPMGAWADRSGVTGALQVPVTLTLYKNEVRGRIPIDSKGAWTAVPPGTRIRLEKIQSFSDGLSSTVWLLGRFEDGPLSGQVVVLNHVARRDEGDVDRIDPAYLMKVD